jgi:molybdopterin synthase sulfur carrier subunit
MTAAEPIRIRLFAALREQAGWQEQLWTSERSEDRSEALTPARIWDALQLPGELSTMRIAINQQFATANSELHPGDELAFLPPISGG